MKNTDKASRAAALAIAGAQRSVQLPGVPTFNEAGVKGYAADAWYGLLAPAATSDAVMQQLQREALAYVGSPSGAEKVRSLGLEPDRERAQAEGRVSLFEKSQEFIQMKQSLIDPSRRQWVTALGGAAALSALGGCAVTAPPSAAEPPRPPPTAVPHSAGTAIPRISMPELACDCHHHIYDRRYPAHPSATLLPDDATVADYRLLQRRLGLQRNVVVQPSTYGVDNRLLVDSLKAFGPSSRGVAVVDTNVTDAQLQLLHAAGVRGIRFNLSFLVGITADMMAPLAQRIAPLGWHLQVNGTADRLLAAGDTLQRLACPVVFDHMGQLPQPQALKHPAFALYARLLDSGRAWFKLSGAYLTSRNSDLSDSGVVARALIGLAPQRMVWGSDWPHPTKKAADKPDDAALLDLLDDWAPTAAIRRQILVDNPAKLYAF